VRLECRTSWFVRSKQQESKIHSSLDKPCSQLQKQFAQMSLPIREQSSTHKWRTPSGWKIHKYFHSVFVILP